MASAGKIIVCAGLCSFIHVSLSDKCDGPFVAAGAVADRSTGCSSALVAIYREYLWHGAADPFRAGTARAL